MDTHHSSLDDFIGFYLGFHLQKFFDCFKILAPTLIDDFYLFSAVIFTNTTLLK